MTSTPARQALLALAATLLALLALASSALAAPLPGSSFDTGDGDQADGLALDWQGAHTRGFVEQSPDANDDCFVGGVKELAPSAWAFNRSAGGCTPGKSNLRVAYVHPESTPGTTFGHFAFFRNDTTGNTFLTFELNQRAQTWTNGTGTTIPCRSDGDVLLSFEVGGSSLSTTLYKWRGTSGPAECPAGGEGTFAGSGDIAAGRWQGTMNPAAPIANFVAPGSWGASFPGNSFGEAAIDLPAVLQSMGENPCFAFVQMQVHSRSSSSISSAMIDYTSPIPVHLESCSVTGTAFQDADGDSEHDEGEPGVPGFEHYTDLDGDGVLDDGEPRATSDTDGTYRITDVPAGTFTVRQVPRAGWRCSSPAPCSYDRSLVTGGNSTGNDFGAVGPSTASGAAFDDLDGDGTRDDGEPPLADVTYYADLDGDDLADGDEPSGTTDTAGRWSIGDIPAGTYAIRQVPRAGWTCSAPAPCESVHTFTSSASATGLVFGLWAGGTIAGTVYEDVDGDGATKADGDVAQAGLRVFLDDGDGTFEIGEATTLTDADGDYVLADLRPGRFTVRVATPSAAWYCTGPVSCTHAVTLTSGVTVSGQSFALSRSATVSGSVFDDASNNGVQDGGEGAWTTGSTVYADLNGNSALDVDEPRSAVAASGTWSIPAVPAGARTIRQLPGAFACTAPAGCAFSLALASGEAEAGLAFGNWVDTQRGVSGTVYVDADANGVRETSETTPAPGWTAYADDNKNAALDAGESTSITNAAGQYAVTFKGNGNVTVRLLPRTGFTCSVPSSCLHSFGLGNGQSEAGRDFAVWGRASISGTARNDLDADGVRDAGETAGVAGRTVYADANASGTLDAGDTSATTDADGAYTLADLTPGTYAVRLVAAAGHTCSAPAGCAYSVALAGASVGGRDFLDHTPGRITGAVREDLDADGTIAEDGGLSGRTVFLDANDDGVQDPAETAVVTDGSGAFAFEAVPVGTHTVRQVLPGTWEQTVPAGARTVAVTSGTTASQTDFGSYDGGTVGGRVFEDANFDGSAHDPGQDAPIAGRVVYADTDGDGTRDEGEPATTTDASGVWSLTGLRPGEQIVRTDRPATSACAFPAPCRYAITGSSRSSATGRDFGEYEGATVSGTVFEDADADDAPREPGEPGLSGRRVFLDGDDDGARDEGEPTALTDPDGSYTIAGVVAADWTAVLEGAAGWTCDLPSDCGEDLSLTSGAVVGGVDFGAHTTGSIAGHLFTDRDRDGGAQVFGENDQPERTVHLDLDGGHDLDAGEPTATTDDRGDFSFTGLPPGTYTVRQLLPTGWSCSVPVSCEREGLVVTSRGAITGQTFSSWTTARLSGRYFEDLDGDGEFPEDGDPGLGGRTVWLDADGDDVRTAADPDTVTAHDGTYAFTALAPGTYAVHPVDQPDGWTCSYPDTCAEELTLEAAESAQDRNVGAWTTGSVSGTVRGDGDPLAGVTVYADLDGDDAHGDDEPTATTAVDGTYALTLDPGTYTIREVRPGGWSCDAPAGCAHSVTVTSQGDVPATDFAHSRRTGASGFVFEDTDGDRVRDDDEPGRAGVAAFADADLDGAHDDGEPRALTGADGAYELDALVAGEHRIAIELPADWLCLTTGCRRTITVAGGETTTGADFALARPATISGTHFEDTDADGADREGGEPAVAGTQVELDLDGDGTFEDGEPTTASDGDGAYAFSGLAPGTYTVRPGAAEGVTCSVPSPCSRTVTLGSGDVAGGRDLGTWRAASVAGTVFDDQDADGAREDGDVPRSGVLVWLDLDGEGDRDAGEPQDTTDADGAYAIPGVRPGAATLRTDLSGGWACSVAADCAQELTPASGAAITGRDVGTWTPATVQGERFDDADADGEARESGEAALAGDVWLDLDGDGERAPGELAAASATTGAYAHTGVRPGTYAQRTTLAGRVCTRPAGCERTVTVTSGQTLAGQDYAGYATASIAGAVGEDTNADGTGDDSLAGRTVVLDGDGDGVADAGEPTTATGVDGTYRFDALVPGRTYDVVVPTADGAECSAPVDCRHTVALASGQAVTGIDVALFFAATVAGVVFEDDDGDGALGGDDTPAAGRTVLLDADDDDAADPGEPTTTTDGDGRYAFAGLVPGDHVVRVAVTGGWSCSMPAAGCRRALTLTSGQTADDRDFALFRGGTIEGTVLDDRDGDGLAGAGDPGLDGQTLFLDGDGDGALDGDEPREVTGADGTYAFDPVRPGTHTVRYRVPGDRRCTIPATCRRTATVTSGAAVAGQDLGSQRVAEPDEPRRPKREPREPRPPAPAPEPAPAPTVLTGTIAEDRDADGRPREEGEPGLAGWTVFVDRDGDGRPGAGEPATTTGADGRYAFTGLPAGDHVVRFASPSPQWVCSLPAGCVRRVTLAPAGQAGGQDFGAWRKALITGVKFADRDRDGSAFERGDAMLAGWTIYADLNRNGRRDGAEPWAVTDADGRYGLTNLPLGTLVVREAPPAGSGYRCSYPSGCSTTVTVASSASAPQADFGGVKGIAQASRRTQLAAPAACQTGRFTLRVRTGLARRAELRVDGRRRGVARRAFRAGRRAYAFRIDARRFRVGVHRVAVRVTFLDGSRRTVRSTFYRCASARPRYTG